MNAVCDSSGFCQFLQPTLEDIREFYRALYGEEMTREQIADSAGSASPTSGSSTGAPASPSGRRAGRLHAQDPVGAVQMVFDVPQESSRATRSASESRENSSRTRPAAESGVAGDFADGQGGAASRPRLPSSWKNARRPDERLRRARRRRGRRRASSRRDAAPLARRRRSRCASARGACSPRTCARGARRAGASRAGDGRLRAARRRDLRRQRLQPAGAAP